MSLVFVGAKFIEVNSQILPLYLKYRQYDTHMRLSIKYSRSFLLLTFFILLVLTNSGSAPIVKATNSPATMGLDWAQSTNHASACDVRTNQNESSSSTLLSNQSNSTYSSTLSPDLNNITKSTDPNIGKLADALAAFRSSLSPEQLSNASFALGNVEQFSWSNLPAGNAPAGPPPAGNISSVAPPPGIGVDRGGIKFGDLYDTTEFIL
jgi:hypothetical protein